MGAPSSDTPSMSRNFIDMLSEFNAAGVEFLVVGAYALAAHARPRYTRELDLWVRPTPDNAARVLAALRRFGSPLYDLTQDDLARAGTVFQTGLPPQRIDVMTSISGVSFEEAWPARASFDVGGIRVHVIGKEHFEQNKRASGRPKDLADIAYLHGAE
jgi:hypothetical protein